MESVFRERIKKSFIFKLVAMIVLFAACCVFTVSFFTIVNYDTRQGGVVKTDDHMMLLLQDDVRVCSAYTQSYFSEILALDMLENDGSYDGSDGEREEIIWERYDSSLRNAFDGTNMMYIVAYGGEVLFTNLTDGEYDLPLPSYLEQMAQLQYGDVYFTNIISINAFDTLSDSEISITGDGAEYDFVVYGAVDKNFAYDDSYSTSYYTANLLSRYTSAAVPGLILSAIAAIFASVFLCSSAGHVNGYDGIRLKSRDKLYMELYTLGGILVLVVMFSVLFVFIEQYILTGSVMYDIVRYGFISGWLQIGEALVLLFIGYLTLLYFIASYVRRYKAKILFKSSLTYLLFKCIGDIFFRIKVTWRVVLIFAAYIFINIFLIVFFNSSVIGWLTIIGFNIVVAGFLSSYAEQIDRLKKGIDEYENGNMSYRINTLKMYADVRQMADGLNKIGIGMDIAVQERMKSERFKTELITNVSHDIKTPLTSIINYIDILKNSDEDDKKRNEYLDIIDRKAVRLKDLIEDLMEASKLSTGNVKINFERLDLNELIKQCIGEYDRRLSEKGLSVEYSAPQKPLYIWADGRHTWRMMDNLFSNINKYALEKTRVYIDLKETENTVELLMKNVSAGKLNISADELMERFVRGDSSRSTEGNGLGLSIAKSLAELQGAEFTIEIDGDLFKTRIVYFTGKLNDPEILALRNEAEE